MQVDDEGWIRQVASEVGPAVRRARESRGWSQAELAARLKTYGLSWHQTAIAKTERGERPLKLVEAVALARELGMVVLTELFGDREADVRESLIAAFVKLEEERRATALDELRRDVLRGVAPEARAEIERQFLELQAQVSESIQDQRAAAFADIDKARGQDLFPGMASAFDLADEIEKERDDG